MAKSYENTEKKKSRLRPHRKIPDVIKDRPKIGVEVIFLWDSFRRLNTERLRDYGPIPNNQIRSYCKDFDIEDFEYFESIIRRVDDKFLELNAPKSSKGK